MVSFDSREQVGHSTTLYRASSVEQEMRNGMLNNNYCGNRVTSRMSLPKNQAWG